MSDILSSLQSDLILRICFLFSISTSHMIITWHFIYDLPKNLTILYFLIILFSFLVFSFFFISSSNMFNTLCLVCLTVLGRSSYTLYTRILYFREYIGIVYLVFVALFLLASLSAMWSSYTIQRIIIQLEHI